MVGDLRQPRITELVNVCFVRGLLFGKFEGIS